MPTNSANALSANLAPRTLLTAGLNIDPRRESRTRASVRVVRRDRAGARRDTAVPPRPGIGARGERDGDDGQARVASGRPASREQTVELGRQRPDGKDLRQATAGRAFYWFWGAAALPTRGGVEPAGERKLFSPTRTIFSIISSSFCTSETGGRFSPDVLSTPRDRVSRNLFPFSRGATRSRSVGVCKGTVIVVVIVGISQLLGSGQETGTIDRRGTTAKVKKGE